MVANVTNKQVRLLSKALRDATVRRTAGRRTPFDLCAGQLSSQDILRLDDALKAYKRKLERLDFASALGDPFTETFADANKACARIEINLTWDTVYDDEGGAFWSAFAEIEGYDADGDILEVCEDYQHEVENLTPPDDHADKRYCVRRTDYFAFVVSRDYEAFLANACSEIAPIAC